MRHCRRVLLDALHSGGNRILGTARPSLLRIARTVLGSLGRSSLHIPTAAPGAGGVLLFRQAGSRWDAAGLEERLKSTDARF